MAIAFRTPSGGIITANELKDKLNPFKNTQNQSSDEPVQEGGLRDYITDPQSDYDAPVGAGGDSDDGFNDAYPNISPVEMYGPGADRPTGGLDAHPSPSGPVNDPQNTPQVVIKTVKKGSDNLLEKLLPFLKDKETTKTQKGLWSLNPAVLRSIFSGKGGGTDFNLSLGGGSGSTKTAGGTGDLLASLKQLPVAIIGLVVAGIILLLASNDGGQS